MNGYFSSCGRIVYLGLKIVKKNSFLTKLDDKSGYDNVLMSENSKSFGVSMEWSLFLM
jgi:hypothetical protein